jgi:hypothetical protein
MKKILLINLLMLQTFVVFSQTQKPQVTESVKDTLYAKRVFLGTKIYKNSIHLSNSFVKSTLKLDSHANTKYTWGKIIQPVGPLVTVGGIALMVKGLTPQYNDVIIDNVKYTYAERSLKNTLLGLGISALGLCLIESSNELIQHSVDIYNDSVRNRKHKVSYQWGITPEGNIGIAMKF